MLKYFYNWRYKRSQRIGAFDLPDRDAPKLITLGSYLSQDTVRGRHFDRFDLPRKRRTGLKLLFKIALFCLFAWLIYESINALEILKN